MKRGKLFTAVALLFTLTACDTGPRVVGVADPAEEGARLNVTPFDPGAAVAAAAASASVAYSASSTDCSFTTVGSVMSLDGDCTTDGTLFVPDGMTLDGNNHTITAVDPLAGHFTGAVLQNGGSWAAVKNLRITTMNLANVCDGAGPPDTRLRGIMFDGASGEIVGNVVEGVNQGASGCQEGNSIEVRNSPFDGTHPNTRQVVVAMNTVNDYQKTGIVVNGDVDATVEHNKLGSSATQASLAANGIQVGFGAIAVVRYNVLEGNQWLGPSDFAATAILVFSTGAVDVSHNRVDGNSDVGLYVFADGVAASYNDIRDFGVDGAHGDYGIFDGGTGNIFDNSLVCGFDEAFAPDPLPGSSNKALPDPACSR